MPTPTLSSTMRITPGLHVHLRQQVASGGGRTRGASVSIGGSGLDRQVMASLLRPDSTALAAAVTRQPPGLTRTAGLQADTVAPLPNTAWHAAPDHARH
jgi:hypothetical protein